MATNFQDASGEVRLVGTIYVPGATPGDVFTVRADGSLAPAPGGGSQPAGVLPVVASEILANLPLTGAATLDGVDVTTGMRVFVSAQADQTENGVWLANVDGTWTRPDDFAEGAEIPCGTLVSVGNAGSAWVNTIWTMYNQEDQTAPIVVGTNTIGLVIIASDVALAYAISVGGVISPILNQFLDGGGYFSILLPPTTDPGVVGALWNDGGSPAISTG